MDRSGEWSSPVGRGRRRWPIALIAVLLLWPLIYASPETPNRHHVGLPRVFSGDEPHYLVILNSLVRDGDADLANNYAAVHQGDSQAGLWFANSPLDHHTVWFEGAKRREWPAVYDLDDWDYDADLHPHPKLRPRARPPVPGHPEFSTHPIGQALLLAPLLWPLRGTDLLEPAAILSSTLAVLLTLWLFRKLIRRYTTDALTIDLVTVVTFLGTPVWHYARSLFNEALLMLLVTAAYSLALRGRSPLVAGLMIGLGMLMKPTLLLLALPLAAMYVIERRPLALTTFALPLAAGVAFTLGYDATVFGEPLRAAQEWKQGSPLNGAFQILFSGHKGLLITTPAILAAFVAWPRFLRDHRRDGAVLLAAVCLQFALFANFKDWHGGSGYSIRYMVPVLPLLFAALVALPRIKWWRSRGFRGAVAAVCLASVLISGRTAIQYWKWWDTNPIYQLAGGKRGG